MQRMKNTIGFKRGNIDRKIERGGGEGETFNGCFDKQGTYKVSTRMGKTLRVPSLTLPSLQIINNSVFTK